jgi:hypothetical protein
MPAALRARRDVSLLATGFVAGVIFAGHLHLSFLSMPHFSVTKTRMRDSQNWTRGDAQLQGGKSGLSVNGSSMERPNRGEFVNGSIIQQWPVVGQQAAATVRNTSDGDEATKPNWTAHASKAALALPSDIAQDAIHLKPPETARSSDQTQISSKRGANAIQPTLPRYCYVWILGSSGAVDAYAKGIKAAVSILKSHRAELIHLTDEGCNVLHTLLVDYVLLITKSMRPEYNAVIDSIRPLFDEIVVTEPIGAKGTMYADHFLKLILLGLYRGGPLLPKKLGGYDRVLYLEADYVPLRSLSHLFLRDPDPGVLTRGPNPEWETVTEEQREDLDHELQRSKHFTARCQGVNQSWPLDKLHRYEPNAESAESDGFIAMPMAYWMPQPCYMAGGPILLHPTRRLYDLYAIPVTHCDEKRHPMFPDEQVCDHDKHFRMLCTETEMGYLNRVLLQNATHNDGLRPYDPRGATVGRTLHEFYTILKNEFVFQPKPREHMRGYYTRNFFKDDPVLTYASLFGVHYAGGDKPWNPEPHDLFGVAMPQYSDLLKLWRAHAACTITPILRTNRTIPPGDLAHQSSSKATSICLLG